MNGCQVRIFEFVPGTNFARLPPVYNCASISVSIPKELQ